MAGRVTFNLPGGRGPLYGKDATTIEAESRRQRAEELPKQGQWGLFPRIDGATSSAGQTPTFGASVYFPAESLSYQLPITHSAIRVSTAVAAQYMDAALFRVETSNTFRLRMVPGTRVRHPCGSTGRIVTPLAKPVILLPNQNYYFGVWISNAGLAFRGLAAGDTGLIRTLTLTSSALTEVADNLTKGYTSPIPLVGYLTEVGNKVY